ncbi:LysR substrate-binding domain-containing protein [Pseudophaeobacter leonis]|uniref:LysR substrate-binding domain-containing protein n=1 Tax=Pseudophaeobacter leonis TaxID=1144477 RepID=UPI003B983190
MGYDSNDLILRSMLTWACPAQRSASAMRCDNQATYWQLVRAGCGIGFCQSSVGCADDAVQELDLGVEIAPLPLWLTAHAAMRETPRIRRVWTLLAKALKNVGKTPSQPLNAGPVIDPEAPCE